MQVATSGVKNNCDRSRLTLCMLCVTHIAFNLKHLDWSRTPGSVKLLPNKNWKTNVMDITVFSLTYSIAYRQCQIWAGVLDVDPALKIQTTHALALWHRRVSSDVSYEALYVSGCECDWRETLVQCCSDAGPSSSKVTYIRPALAWRLLVACADPVLHPDLTHSIYKWNLCS